MLRKAMIEQQAGLHPVLSQFGPAQRPSAINLAHYLALRRFDLRPLQERLSGIGVSSPGRAETHVMANLDKVLGILHRLAGREWAPHQQDEPSGIHSGEALLARHARHHSRSGLFVGRMADLPRARQNDRHGSEP